MIWILFSMIVVIVIIAWAAWCVVKMGGIE